MFPLEFTLPREAIAQQLAKPRDNAKLMVLRLQSNDILHATFRDLPNFLCNGDVLILNDTKVKPAKLVCQKITGGRVSILFVDIKNECKALCKINGKKIRIGTKFKFDNTVFGEVTGFQGGLFELKLNTSVNHLLDKYGETPLPPYIRGKVPAEDYQTVYATKLGSIAAPTAGLHFTEDCLKRLTEKGVSIVYITLHIGLATFTLVKDVEKHQMAAEYYSIPAETAEKVSTLLSDGGRLFVVGTSTLKALETVYTMHGNLVPISGCTTLFIKPPYKLKTPLDGFITNFHLPNSPPLLLTAAVTGCEKLMQAYQVAIEKQYRFYSLGDAMLILR